MAGRVTGPGPQHELEPIPDTARARVGEPLQDAIRRVVLAQYDILIDALTLVEDVDSTIHTARKAMKRIRGLLRLDRPAWKHGTYAIENAVLRDVARELAPIRDGYVLIETYDDLTTSLTSTSAPDSIRTTHEFLTASYLSDKHAVLEDDAHLARAIHSLSASRSRIDSLPLATANVAASTPEFDLIKGGLRRTYRTGRRTHERAGNEEAVGAFHAWRKPVKYLRYQMELLSGSDPGAHNRLVESLSELGDVLGLEHDLDVLAAFLDRNPGATPDAATHEEILRVIAERGARHRSAALTLGTEIYAESPDDFVDRIRTYWTTGRA